MLTVSLTTFAAMCIVILFLPTLLIRFSALLFFSTALEWLHRLGQYSCFVKEQSTLMERVFMKWNYTRCCHHFILVYSFVVAISIAVDQPKTALTGVAVLAAFMIIYFATKKPNSDKECTSEWHNRGCIVLMQLVPIYLHYSFCRSIPWSYSMCQCWYYFFFI